MSQICSAMREAPADSHDDLHIVLACLTSMVKRSSSELSDKAKAIIVDMIDEITGQVENDQIEQHVEAEWYSFEMNRRAA
jgi:hypothetical protein